MRCLIIGGDGLLGRAARERLTEAGVDCYFTSRRLSARGSDRCLYLDLADIRGFELQFTPDLVLLLAGAGSMLKCEEQVKYTYKVNVTNTVALAARFKNQGAFVVFPSTTAVFDGETPAPIEGSPVSYTTEYGRQKAIAEQQLLALDPDARRIAVIRLTKVASSSMLPFAAFLSSFRNRSYCEAFSDLMLSPISVPYALDAFVEAFRQHVGGLLHLSGEEELSYVDFARRLAMANGLDAKLVIPVHSSEKGVNLLYKPRHPMLGMSGTSERLGVFPEPLTLSVARI